MKILVVGAGPAGLMFASQMKLRKPDWSINIVERNLREDVPGWGVVLPGRPPHHPANPLSYLDHPDRLHPQFLDEFRLALNQDAHLTSTGVTLCGVERRSLVQAMRARCEDLGIGIRYGTPCLTSAQWEQADCDLVVFSSGVSAKATHLPQALAPQVSYGSNKYIWYGTDRLFNQMNLVCRSHGNGVFIAHAYRYSESMSTFIVECSEQTFTRSALSQRSDQGGAALVADIFQHELAGHTLVGQPGQGWRNFMTLSRDRSYEGKCVLIGDALQSGHFSIGHGTTMAVVGALLLVKALSTHSAVPAALEDVDSRVMPLMKLFAEHAHSSRVWFETAATRMHLTSAELAQSFEARRQGLPCLQTALAANLGYALDR